MEEQISQQNDENLNIKEENSIETTKPKLTKKESFIQFLKFVGFSISAGVIQIGLTEILMLIGLKGELYWISYLSGLIASVIWNFTLNRKFTFKSANNVPIAMTLVFLFYLVFTPCSTLWSDALQKVGWDETLVTLFSMVINFVTEFIYDRFVVFRKSINTNNLAKKQEQKKEEKI